VSSEVVVERVEVRLDTMIDEEGGADEGASSEEEGSGTVEGSGTTDDSGGGADGDGLEVGGGGGGGELGGAAVVVGTALVEGGGSDGRTTDCAVGRYIDVVVKAACVRTYVLLPTKD